MFVLCALDWLRTFPCAPTAKPNLDTCFRRNTQGTRNAFVLILAMLCCFFSLSDSPTCQQGTEDIRVQTIKTSKKKKHSLQQNWEDFFKTLNKKVDFNIRKTNFTMLCGVLDVLISKHSECLNICIVIV